jgi:hypothetical protein
MVPGNHRCGRNKAPVEYRVEVFAAIFEDDSEAPPLKRQHRSLNDNSTSSASDRSLPSTDESDQDEDEVTLGNHENELCIDNDEYTDISLESETSDYGASKLH